jgi:hypothetical protein
MCLNARVRRALVAVTVALCAVGSLSGCGSDESPSGSANRPAGAPSASPARQYTKTDLQGALLRTPDLPAGYVDQNPGKFAPPDPRVFTTCLADLGGASGAPVEAEFQNQAAGRTVQQALTLLPPGTTLREIESKLKRCTEGFGIPGSGPGVVTRTDHGSYADETLGYSIRLPGNGFSATEVMVFMRKGTVLGALSIGGYGDGPPPDTKAILTKAAAKLPA